MSSKASQFIKPKTRLDVGWVCVVCVVCQGMMYPYRVASGGRQLAIFGVICRQPVRGTGLRALHATRGIGILVDSDTDGDGVSRSGT
jgi:hypothetical protein